MIDITGYLVVYFTVMKIPPLFFFFFCIQLNSYIYSDATPFASDVSQKR